MSWPLSSSMSPAWNEYVFPPTNGRFSISVVGIPASTKSSDAVSPANPPPITMTSGVVVSLSETPPISKG